MRAMFLCVGANGHAEERVAEIAEAVLHDYTLTLVAAGDGKRYTLPLMHDTGLDNAKWAVRSLVDEGRFDFVPWGRLFVPASCE